MVPPEYPVILSVYNKFKTVKRWTPELLSEFDKTFREKLPSPYWKIEYLNLDEVLLRKLISEASADVTVAELIKIYYLSYQSVFETQEALVLGDKNPIYATFVKRLMKIFPDARFIFLTRDYRDNFVSVRKFSFEAPIMALQAYRWKYVTRQLLNLKSKYPNQFIHIKHEELISDSSKTLNKVCDFLGVEMDEGMFNYYKKKDKAYRFIEPEHFDEFHAGLGQPINPSHVGLWEMRLTDKEVMIADAVVGHWAEKSGYERKFRYVSSFLLLKTIPWQIYGYFLYKLMYSAEYFPAPCRKVFARLLPQLSKFWHRFFKKAK